MPFLSDAFVAATNMQSDDLPVKEFPHLDFSLAADEDGPTSTSTSTSETSWLQVELDHDTNTKVAIMDATTVQLLTQVHYGSEFLDTPQSCPAEGVLMCAFNEWGVVLNCEVTDALGVAVLTVPPGFEILLKNGCSGAHQIKRCEEENLRP